MSWFSNHYSPQDIFQIPKHFECLILLNYLYSLTYIFFPFWYEFVFLLKIMNEKFLFLVNKKAN